MGRVSIIDYGIGNILSVQRAFSKIGCETERITTGDEVLRAEHLILPGVGAFGDGMAELNKRNLVDPIKKYCAQNRPFLGICLGMQMMLDSSEESENVKGMGIIGGDVKKLSSFSENGTLYKIPNIGWYGLQGCDWDNTILKSIERTSKFYFVHSYAAYPKQKEYSLAETQYGNQIYSAVLRKGNCYGTQFHPEKSGEDGLRVICDFARITCEKRGI